MANIGYLCDGDVQAMFVRSGFIGRGYRPTLKTSGRAANNIRISRTEVYKMHEQKVCAILEFGAERKILNSFVAVGGDSDEGEEIWVARVLLLCRCSVKRDMEGLDLAFAQWLQCVPFLDAVYETIKCVCLR